MIRIVLAAALVCAAASPRLAESCIASWNGRESGPLTVPGERFYPDGIPCADKTRAFGSVVTVTHLGSGRSIACRMNDGGPSVKGLCIDLSHGAAKAFGLAGVARVRVD